MRPYILISKTCVIYGEVRKLVVMQNKNAVKLGYIHLSPKGDYEKKEGKKKGGGGASAKPSPLQNMPKC